MRVDATGVQLRPRPMYEAADLGVRLVQAHAAALLRCALPVYAVLALLALALQPLAVWLPSLALWWAKPWLDRTLLFVLSRALFRQDTRFADLWAARRAVFGHGLLSSLTLRRLSPWRSFTQPALQLEGLQGAPLRKRLAQLRNGHQGVALAISYGVWHLEAALAVGLPALVFWLVPGGEMSNAVRWIAGAGEAWTYGVFNAAYALAIAIVEPFYVGAGFAMYLNRRVELEAWDVEQALRHAFAP